MSECEDVEVFELSGEDWLLVQLARQTARELLSVRHVSPSDIRGIGVALEALDRLPEISSGVDVSFGVTIDPHPELETSSGTLYLLFRIAENEIGIVCGGIARHRHGWDTFTSDGYLTSLSGNLDRTYPPREAKEKIFEYLDRGGRVEVDDQSDYTELSV